MKKILLAFALALLGVIAAQAENYGINVGGVEVSSSNYNNVTGGDINSGATVKYDRTNKVLTLSGLNMTRTGGSNYAVHNRSVSGLTIKFVGSNTFKTVGAGLKLMESTDIIVDGTSSYAYFTCTGTSDNQNGMNISSGKTVNISGTGKIQFYTSGSSSCKEGVKGGGSSTKINLKSSITMTVHSAGTYGISSLSLCSYDGSKLVVVQNGAQSFYQCYWSSNNKAAVLAPVGAYYSNGTIYTSSGSPVTRDNIEIHSDYVALINSAYFPDANFRSYLLSLYPKGYITSGDVNSRTSLSPSSRNISSLTGLSYFSKLTELDCSYNNISTLPTLPSTLKTLKCASNKLTRLALGSSSGVTYLDCSSNQLTSLDTPPSSLVTLNCSYNQLTSLPTMPSTIQEINAGSNKFTTLSVIGKTALKTLNVSNNANMTSLECYSNALTSLNVNGCTALSTLKCGGNQLTSLGTLPNSVAYIDCSSNPFTSFTLTGRSNLKTLIISNCTSLTSLECYSNALTSLSTAGCSAMTSLICSNNQLTSLGTLPNSVKTLNCSSNQLTSLPSLPTAIETIYGGNNKFTSLDITTYFKLKYLDVANNTLLTSLNCYSNALTTLNVSGCTVLTHLNCSNNQLTSLPTLPNSLQTLKCGLNKFTSLSVTGYSNLKTLSVYNCSNLTTLNCQNNALTSLDVSDCSALKSVNCSSNQLTSLPSMPSTIQEINAGSNKFNSLSVIGKNALKTLNVSSNANLTTLYCNSNALTSLDVSGCTLMTYLDCSSNQLTSLGTLPSALHKFFCPRNKLTSLPTLPSALEILDCQSNQLTSLPTLPSTIQEVYANENKFTTLSVTEKYALKTLNVSNNTNLATLECQNNALTSLNMGGCTALSTLICYNNELTSLDVTSASNTLSGLYCQLNELSSLNVQGFSKMYTLNCCCNKLTSLSVQGCNALIFLYINNNQISGSGMNTLVNSLRTIPDDTEAKIFIYSEQNIEEQNAITDDQLTVVRDKNWLPYKFANNNWVLIEAPEPPQPTYKVGDVDGNGEVDGNDLNLLINILLGKDDADNYDGRANVDGNGGVDGNDLNALINILLGK